MRHPKSDISFAKGLSTVLAIILFFKISGYFTFTENVAITRVLKVLIRISMTVWIWLIYRKLVKMGNIPSFKWEHVLAPFFYATYLCLGFASLLWSTNPGYSLLQLSMNAESFVFAFLFLKTFVLLRAYYPEANIRFSSMMSWAVFFVLSVFVIGKYIDPDTFYRLTHGGEEARLGGYLMNPNELGMLAVVGISCCLIELTQTIKKWKIVFIMVIMIYALILTGSRSSLIGFFLVIFYFVNQSKNSKLKMAIYVSAFMAIPLIVNTIFIKQGDIEEVLSMTGRLPFWKALLTEGLPKEPFFGFGYMRIAYTDTFQSVHTYAGMMTHNTFIQVLMNLGFVGFSIMVLQLSATMRGFFRSKNKLDKAFFIGILIPIIINSFTEFGIFGESNFGILFYQLLIWLFVISFNSKLTPREAIILENKRPEFYKKLISDTDRSH
ncbi:MAG: O-antigen ligase family protein [Chitinophagales bacterium]|nr:O-antigen ligase family protein [Chitinophagales bacterium]